MRKRSCLIAFVVFLCIIIGGVWYLAAFRRGIISGYYEWAMTEAICAYGEDNDGRLPTGWEELKPYECCSKHFNAPASMIDAKTHVRVNFEDLTKLKQGKISKLPRDTIEILRGLHVHWVNSSYLLERYILQNEFPNGAWKKRDVDRFNPELQSDRKGQQE